MSGPENDKKQPADCFFNAILEAFPSKEGIASVVVTHILPDRPALLRAIGKSFTLEDRVGQAAIHPPGNHGPVGAALRIGDRARALH
jgi:hypothetical protein